MTAAGGASCPRLGFQEPCPRTVGPLVQKAAGRLAEAGVPEARANAELIMAHVLGCNRPAARLEAARPLEAAPRRRFWRLVAERSRRVPLAYVLGSQDFMGLDIRVTPAALIPRPETEELAQAAVDILRSAARRGGAVEVLDAGAGSGCVSIALASLIPEAKIVATDISPSALALARENARRHGLSRRIRFVKADIFQPPSGSASPWADLVVSNPPYVPTAALASLEPEVLQEPRLALDGGPDGLDAIRALIKGAPRNLRPGGWLLIEIGHGQEGAVRELMAHGRFEAAQVRPDAQGIARIAMARRPARVLK